MVGFSHSGWVDWFSITQAVGIIGSLLLAAAAAHREARAREIENLLVIAEHHRELWSEAHRREDLARVFSSHASDLSTPPTVAEEEFANLAMVHFQTTWCIANTGGIITRQELAADVRGFFSLPLPRAVWEKTKQYRNPKFVRFVEKALEARAPGHHVPMA